MKYVVYFIKCLENHKVYIGRSQEYKKRFRSHKNLLRRGQHNNLNLQNDWSKYGEHSFSFEVIHSVDVLEDSVNIEQQYLDDQNLNKYNIQTSAFGGGDTFSNNPRSESTRALISINSTGKNNPMYGVKKSDLMIQRVKEANSKPISINGKEYSSITEASKDLKVLKTTLCYRLSATSSKFEGYKYL